MYLNAFADSIEGKFTSTTHSPHHNTFREQKLVSESNEQPTGQKSNGSGNVSTEIVVRRLVSVAQ